MKNLLHFGKIRILTHEEIKKLNLERDSGNGYYSYSYYVLPYSGQITEDNKKNIYRVLFDKHYRAPFSSLKDWSIFSENEILVGVTCHHGD